MQILKKYPLLILFAAFLIITSIADMFVSRREFSEMENRYLEQRPKFSFAQLWRNEYTPKYEKYVNDQFIGRDGWITLKSVSESALGKIENNGIVYGKEHHMFEYYRTTDERRIELNTGFINKFIGQYGEKTPITVSIIPNSYEILDDLMPAGLENIDQQAVIAKVYSELDSRAKTLDLEPVMRRAVAEAKKNNPQSFPGIESQIYYRTDHHWTTLGAYHAYRAFIQSRGLQAVELGALEPLAYYVDGFYGSYYSKCKLFSAVPDTIEVYDIPFDSITIDGEEKSTLHDLSKWTVRDKHAGFLWGNNGLTVIKSENNLNHAEGETSRVLLIKDSYGNPFAPFLTYSYDEVWVIDLRSLPQKMSELMEENSFDDVLILYNFMNYASDTNVAFMTY